MNIIQKLSPNFGSRRGYNPELIVVHIMAGKLEGTIEWFQNPTSQVSSHYGTGLDGSIVQFVQDKDEAWTEGNVKNPSAKLLKPNVNPNYYCLGIENEGQDLSKAPDIQLNTLTELIYSLCIKYNIPADRDHIIGHYEIDSVTRPNCPSADHSIMDKLVAMVVNYKNNQNKNMNVKNIYRVSKIQTVVTFETLTVDENALLDNGNYVALPETPVTENVVTYESTMTIDAIVTDAKEKQANEVVVGFDVK